MFLSELVMVVVVVCVIYGGAVHVLLFQRVPVTRHECQREGETTGYPVWWLSLAAERFLGFLVTNGMIFPFSCVCVCVCPR